LPAPWAGRPRHSLALGRPVRGNCSTHVMWSPHALPLKTHFCGTQLAGPRAECEEAGCGRRAYYNFKGGAPLFCRTHKEAGMVRCPQCPK